MTNSSDKNQYPKLPDKFGSKVMSFPECSYGAVKVTLVLASGRRVYDVIIGPGTICKIGQRLINSAEDLDFQISDIVEVEKG
jgi:hypothetical protein